MPWCPRCARVVETDELTSAGAHPECGSAELESSRRPAHKTQRNRRAARRPSVGLDNSVADEVEEEAEIDEHRAADDHEQDDEIEEHDGAEDDDGTRSDRPKPPWHFKLMLWGTSIYLSYRLYQGITWVVHHV